MFKKDYFYVVILCIMTLFYGCEKEDITSDELDRISPTIYLLDKDGNRVDNADTVVLLFTKFNDPGIEAEDSISTPDNIQIESDIEIVLPIEKKNASHLGEVKKTGDYTITYTATDEAGNANTKSKVISVKNVSDIYTGRYWTSREEIVGDGISDICQPAEYYSNITASNNMAGRIRFSKVAQHNYNGQNVSFKVDADLYSPTLSSRTRSDQVGFLGKADDKEVAFYNGMSYDAAVDTMRMNYVYLIIPTQEYKAYTEDDTEVPNYTVIIKGSMEGTTPKSMIVYDESGVMQYIELQLYIGVNHQGIQNYIERYYPE